MPSRNRLFVPETAKNLSGFCSEYPTSNSNSGLSPKILAKSKSSKLKRKQRIQTKSKIKNVKTITTKKLKITTKKTKTKQVKIKQEKIKFNKIQAGIANVKLGLAYLRNGMNKRAKFKLNRALMFAPKLPEAHSAMAYYLEKVGEINEALIYHKNAISFSENNVMYINNYASFLCNNGKYKEALNYYDIALKKKIYVDLPIVFKNAGLCAYKANLLPMAKQYLQKAIKHDEYDEDSQALLDEIKKLN